jgi:hypothetical protein
MEGLDSGPDSRNCNWPAAAGRFARLFTYITMQPCQAKTKGVPLFPRAEGVDKGLGDCRELISVLGQPGNTLHFRLIQDQQHEDIIGHLPLAPNSMRDRRAEAKSWVIGPVP